MRRGIISRIPAQCEPETWLKNIERTFFLDIMQWNRPYVFGDVIYNNKN